VRAPVTLALLLAATPAQDLPIRSDSVAVLQLDGPARFRSAFLATNVGTMLAAKEAGDFWTTFADPFTETMRRLSSWTSGLPLTNVLRELDGYQGRITVGIELTPHEQAWAGIPPNLTVAVVLAADGRTDLEALAARVHAAARGLPKPVERRVGADGPVDVLALGKARGVVLPRIVDGRLLAVFTEHLAHELGRTRGAAFVPDAELAEAPFALTVDLPRIVDLLDDDRALDFVATDRAKVLDALGLLSLRELRLTLRPAGPHVRVETSVRFTDGDRGFFAGWFPDSQAPPRLVAFAPADARYWHAGKLRPDLVYRSLCRTAAFMFGDGDYETTDRQGDRVLGIDLEADLLAHVGEDCLWIGSQPGDDRPGADPADVRLGDASGNLCMVYALRDAAAFERAWRRMLEQLDTRVEPDDEPVAGTTLHRVHRGFFGDYSWAIVDDAFALGVGDHGHEWLRATLAWRAEVLARGDDGTELPPSLARLVGQAPPGFQGGGSFDVRRLVSLPVLSWFDDDETLSPILRGVGDALTRLSPILARHQLGEAVAFTGYADHLQVYRVFW
jgi:hypothetical protein